MAEEKKEEEAKEGEAEAAPKKKSKKKLFIIIAVVVLLAGGGGAFAMLGGTPPPTPEEQAAIHEEEEAHYETVELDTFIVNLSENASFLKVKLLLEYDPKVVNGAAEGKGEGGGHGGGGSGGGEGGGGLPGVLGEKEPMIKDAIIRVLSSKRTEQVLSVEGKEEIKEELVEAINEATGLDEPAVVSVYFTEFIVQ